MVGIARKYWEWKEMAKKWLEMAKHGWKKA